MANKVTFPPEIGGDGSTVTDDSSPTTGLGNGGFRTRLLPMFTNIINVVNWMIGQGNTQVSAAATSASAAAASAATALNAPGTSSTSATSLTVGVGAQSLTIQAGKQIVVGMFVVIASTASPANWMHGNVTAYNSATGALTVQVDSIGGSGTFANWTISLSGASAATPPQAGNAGKVLTTNGTTTAWGYAGITTVVATATASTTLANGTGYLYVPTQMTAIGQAVTLPAANTLTTGPNFVIDNSKGAYPVGIRDNTGTLLMGVAAGGIASVSLKDNSTVAGIWSIHGTSLEPGLVSVDTTLSATYLSAFNSDLAAGVFVALNNNQSLHFVSNAAKTGFYACIVDNVGKQVTTPVLVASGLTSACKVGAAFAVSATSVIVFYSDNTNATNAVVLSISGTTISVGAPATVASSASGLTFQEDGYSGPRIAQLSPTLYVVTSATVSSPGWTAVCAFSVSGTTVTAGAVASIATTYGVGTTVYALTATTALVIYALSANGSAPSTVYAVVVTVSGTTCTVGAPVAAPSSPYVGTFQTSTQPGSCLLSPTQALVVTDGYTSNYVIAVTCNISGTTVSWGAQFQVETGLVSAAGQLGYNNRNAPRLLPLSATSAFLWYFDIASGISYSRSVVLTVNGAAISAGAILYDAISDGGTGNASGFFGSILPFSTSEFLAIKARAAASSQSGTGGFAPFLQPSAINGTTVTTGYGRNLLEFGPTQPSQVVCNRLAGGDYVLSAQSPATPVLSVFRSNGNAINSRGNIPVPALLPTALITNLPQIGAVASNRVVLFGSTVNTSGPTAGTGQVRILNVEIAA